MAAQKSVTREEYELLDTTVQSLKKTVKILFALVVVLVLIIGGYIVYKEVMQPTQAPQLAAAAQPSVQDEAPYDIVTSYPKLGNNERIRGNKNAQYVMIEYSDYECPFCKRFHDTGVALMKEYGDKMAWVYRNYPLPFHPRALPSAVVSMCVFKLGGNDAFWKYTDTVFEKQGTAEDALNDDKLASYAEAAGINGAALSSCITDESLKTQIDTEAKEGGKYGIQGTPGIFILNTKNGKVAFVKGAVPLETFKAAIEKIS